MSKKNNLLLGAKTEYQLNQPDKKILQAVDNPHLDVDYSIKLTCPEFTSICPNPISPILLSIMFRTIKLSKANL